MPRRSVLLTAHPVDASVVTAAADRIWQTLRVQNPQLAPFELVTIDDGAALQVRSGDGDVLLTVLRPKLLPGPAEVARLLPGVDAQQIPTGTCWAEAYAPWTEAGLIGVAIAQSAAEALFGQVAHSRNPVPNSEF